MSAPRFRKCLDFLKKRSIVWEITQNFRPDGVFDKVLYRQCLERSIQVREIGGTRLCEFRITAEVQIRSIEENSTGRSSEFTKKYG